MASLRDLIAQLLSYRGPGPESGPNPALAGRRPIPGVFDTSGGPVLQRGAGPGPPGGQMGMAPSMVAPVAPPPGGPMPWAARLGLDPNQWEPIPPPRPAAAVIPSGIPFNPPPIEGTPLEDPYGPPAPKKYESLFLETTPNGGLVIEDLPGNLVARETAESEDDPETSLLRRSRARQDMLLELLRRGGYFGGRSGR